jgi:hypothetical protein
MRPTIGLLAVVLLIAGAVLRDPSNETVSATGGACLRVGILMAIWWFAYPQLRHLPGWLVGACLVSFLFVMRWPRLLLVAIPLLAILWFLGPRTPRKPRAP